MLVGQELTDWILVPMSLEEPSRVGSFRLPSKGFRIDPQAVLKNPEGHALRRRTVRTSAPGAASFDLGGKGSDLWKGKNRQCEAASPELLLGGIRDAGISKEFLRECAGLGVQHVPARGQQVSSLVYELTQGDFRRPGVWPLGSEFNGKTFQVGVQFFHRLLTLRRTGHGILPGFNKPHELPPDRRVLRLVQTRLWILRVRVLPWLGQGMDAVEA